MPEDPNIKSVAPSDLANLLGVGTTFNRTWEPADLGAILRHQLQTPLALDLSPVAPGEEKTITGLIDGVASQPPRTFAELLHHPRPPVELLMYVKEFCKATRRDPSATVPPDVAKVLYYAAIAAGLLRGGQRISELGDAQLLAGMKWAANREWTDPATKTLLAEAAQHLTTPSP